MHRRHILALGLSLAVCYQFAVCCHAQEPDAPVDQPSETFHLRTYVNRIQIATLVLGRNMKPVEGLKASSFGVSLDSGPEFRPSQSRVQGDDPLSVAVLIDASGSQPELIERIGDALARLAPTELHAEDHISIFAADCTMIRTRLNGHADREDIKRGVTQALSAIHPPGKKTKHCGDSFRLWDFVSYMIDQMSVAPGRRVALIVSGGHAQHSPISLLDLSRLAGRRSVALFGIRDRAELSPPGIPGGLPRGRTADPTEDPFEILCSAAGGVVFEIDPVYLQETTKSFLHFVRSRYILEFPRPDGGITGLHDMSVYVPKQKNLIVHAAGASYLGPDASLADDPNVLPSSASQAVFGARRPIVDPKH